MAKTFALTNERAKELKATARQVLQQEGDWRVAAEDLFEFFDTVAEMTEPAERVIFRKFPWDSKTMALFPDQYNEKTGNIGCYTEDGGQEETSPDFGDTVAAEPGEYVRLQNILARQGYTNLRPVKRFGKLGRK